MSEYRIVEKSDGRFYIQRKWLWIWLHERDSWDCRISKESLQAAQNLVASWRKQESKPTTIHQP